MSDRFYVGGNNSSWDVVSSWSASSGGSPGASVPTSSDNIFFDANSGLQTTSHLTFTSSSTLNCANATFSQAGNLSFGTGSMTLNVYGSAVLVNITGGAPLILGFRGTGAQTLQNTNADSFLIYIYPATLTLTLLSNLSGYVLQMYGGTFDLNHFNLTIPTIINSGSTAGALYLRDGTITAASALQLSSTTIVIYPGTATLNLAGPVVVAPSVTFYRVVATSNITFNTNFSATTFACVRGATYQFQPSITLTVTNPIVQTGGSSSATTFKLATGSTNFTLSSPAQQYLSNVSISNCTAAGSGSPHFAIGSSTVAATCVNWIKPKAIVFAGD